MLPDEAGSMRAVVWLDGSCGSMGRARAKPGRAFGHIWMQLGTGPSQACITITAGASLSLVQGRYWPEVSTCNRHFDARVAV
jgi:hypothetical protein